MTSGTESARTTDSLLDGAALDTIRGNDAILFWHEVNDGQIGVELFRVRIIDKMSLAVIPGSFQIHAIDECTILWRLQHVFLGIDGIELFHVETEHVDRNSLLACIVLQNASEKCLREEEAADPEHGWLATLDPLVYEVLAIQ